MTQRQCAEHDFATLWKYIQCISNGWGKWVHKFFATKFIWLNYIWLLKTSLLVEMYAPKIALIFFGVRSQFQAYLVNYIITLTEILFDNMINYFQINLLDNSLFSHMKIRSNFSTAIKRCETQFNCICFAIVIVIDSKQ